MKCRVVQQFFQSVENCLNEQCSPLLVQGQERVRRQIFVRLLEGLAQTQARSLILWKQVARMRS